MKLLTRDEYDKVENMLKDFYAKEIVEPPYLYKEAIEELKAFFIAEPYKTFLEIFFLNRHQYKYRYPSNSMMLKYLSDKLYLQEPTLYIMRREIVYKASMIFYKYNLL